MLKAFIPILPFDSLFPFPLTKKYDQQIKNWLFNSIKYMALPLLKTFSYVLLCTCLQNYSLFLVNGLTEKKKFTLGGWI